MEQLNIVELIENNPISKLTHQYNNKLLNKIKEKFNGFEKQLFVSIFYCYLNYYKNIDFVIDLDNIWNWIGFSQKVKAVALLERNFKINKDYKILDKAKSSLDLLYTVDKNNLNKILKDEKSAFQQEKALFSQEDIYENNSNQNLDNNDTKDNFKKNKQNGGQNIKKIFLTIKCFKLLCMKAQTKKADEIHEYYLNMEELLQEIIEEQSDELKLQLEQKENIILEIQKSTEEEKEELIKQKKLEVEKAIISQFPSNTECVYIGTIENISEKEEKLIKFGCTNNLHQRVLNHKKDYNNFILIEAFRVQNKAEIENLIRSHNKIKKQIRTIFSNEKNRTEIIAYDDINFTIEQLKKSIKDIIHAKTYCIENYNKILKENEEFEKENNELKEKFEERLNILKEQYEFKILTLELEVNEQKKITYKIALENQEMQEKIDKQKDIVEIIKNEQELIYQNPLIPEDELTAKFANFIDTMCIVHPEVEEASTKMEGQFRIWLRDKPRKEVFYALKNYLDTRFKPARISNKNQDKKQLVHGYIGVQLKPIEYKKKHIVDDYENFIFQVCKFSPSGKILYSTLLTECQKWKESVGLKCNDNDLDKIKEYLNASEYVIKATVWTDKGSNEGYYGLMLKSEDNIYKNTSSTGKKVNKIQVSTGYNLGSWDTIAKAAQIENISPAKMSRSIKAKTVFKEDYYYTTE